MKTLWIKSLCAALAVCAALLTTACGSSGAQSSTQGSTAPAGTAAAPTRATLPPNTTMAPLSTETDLTKLHQPQKQDDPFAGYWQITEGTGAELSSFVFSFDGSNNAYLLIGTMGYCGVYEVKQKDNQEVFTTQLQFGLNGDYTFAFAEDKRSVVLTSLSNKTTTTMQKLDSFSSIPNPPESPAIDPALLGAWKDDTGEILYFDKNGIFYDTQTFVTFTFYTYSAADGSIQMQYTMKDLTDETATYKVEGDTLTYNDYAYKRIPAEEVV